MTIRADLAEVVIRLEPFLLGCTSGCTMKILHAVGESVSHLVELSLDATNIHKVFPCAHTRRLPQYDQVVFVYTAHMFLLIILTHYNKNVCALIHLMLVEFHNALVMHTIHYNIFKFNQYYHNQLKNIDEKIFCKQSIQIQWIFKQFKCWWCWIRSYIFIVL